MWGFNTFVFYDILLIMLDFTVYSVNVHQKIPNLLPFDFEGRVSERLAVLVYLLNDSLVGLGSKTMVGAAAGGDARCTGHHHTTPLDPQPKPHPKHHQPGVTLWRGLRRLRRPAPQLPQSWVSRDLL